MNSKPSAPVYLLAPIFTFTILFVIAMSMAPRAYAQDEDLFETIEFYFNEIPVEEDKILKDTKLEYCISKNACGNKSVEVVIDVKAGSLQKPIIAKLLINKGEVGSVEVDLSETYGGGEIAVYQIELDETNDHEEIVINSYTGGAHCCSNYKILAVYDGKLTFNHFIMVDGKHDISMHEDGKLFFDDNRFLYAFGSYADSYSVPRFYDYQQGKIIDISKEPQYKQYYLDAIKELKPKCGKVEDLPACAAYAAAAARVGKFKKVWKFINKHYKFDPDRYELNPTFCKGKGPDDLDCPESEQVKFNAFPDALLYTLQQWDYVEK